MPNAFECSRRAPTITEVMLTLATLVQNAQTAKYTYVSVSPAIYSPNQPSRNVLRVSKGVAPEWKGVPYRTFCYRNHNTMT
jgi:hypothetical protein